MIKNTALHTKLFSLSILSLMPCFVLLAFSEGSKSDLNIAQSSYAWDTIAGTTIALTIDTSESNAVPIEQLPANAVVMQTYSADGSMTFKGYGEHTIDSTGTYTYTKLGPNFAIEETQQRSEELPKPFSYKMLFIFDTPHSGRWHQNFGDGLIFFSGTFNSFPTK